MYHVLRSLSFALLAVGSLPAVSINGVGVTNPQLVAGSGSFTAGIFTTAEGNAVKIQGVLNSDCTALCITELTANVFNTLGGNILLHYDFTFSASAGNFDRNWGFYDINSVALATGVGDAFGDVLISPGFLRFTATSGDAFSLTIPANSIDLMPTSAPEPGTVALGLAGLALVAIGRRRGSSNAR